jgi:hypothetical protein
MNRKRKFLIGAIVGLLLVALAWFLKKKCSNKQSGRQPPIDV